MWPFNRSKPVEQRAAAYTDSLVNLLIAQAAGNMSAGDVGATAALESATGVVGRGFAAAEVTGGATDIVSGITPDTLETIGRAMVRNGDVVYLIDTSDGMVNLLPAQAHNVKGGPMPSSWRYDVTVGGPSQTHTYDDLSWQAVLHFRYAAHQSAPWRGQSPLEVAYLSGKLSAETVRALADESSGPITNLLGLPVDGDDPSIAKFKQDIAGARGKMVPVETGDWDATNGAVVDLAPKRLGAMPPDSMVNLHQQASNEVYAAIGFNPALFISGDAASLRESWRLALFGVLAPLGRKIAAELRLKLDPSIDLTWTELRASDIQARARSVGSLVQAGATLDSAAREVGFDGLQFDSERMAAQGGENGGRETTDN